MAMRDRRAMRAFGVLILGMVVCASASGGISKQKKEPQAGSPPDVALREYIARVRAEKAAETMTPGSIWSPTGRLTNLVSDVKAVRAHDPIPVAVSESLTASTDGAVTDQRASTASSQVSALLGKLSAGNALNNLLNQ